MRTAFPLKRVKTRHFAFRYTVLTAVACFMLMACGGEDEPGPSQNVVEPVGPDVSLESVELSTTEVMPGERVTVSAFLVNSGDRSGEITLNLEMDGEMQLSQQRFVSPPNAEGEGAGELTVDLPWTAPQEGHYTLSVNGMEAGQVVVSAPQVNIQVVSATLERAESDAIFLAGEPVFVVAEAQNSGDAHGEALLELEVDGDVVAEQVVFVYSPGAGDTPETTTQEVVFEWIPDSAGLFELSVSTVDAGEVQVVSPPQVAITAPTNAPSDFFFIEAEDEERGFFVEVDFAATVIDELDGPLEGDALQWSTSADENNDGTVTRRSLGQGDAFSARLYMANEACGAITEHLIEVKATNSAGLTNSAYHRVIVRMGRC